ncbi:unnamed protein product [Acanthoscelides obtectus]|uniref:Uncharacterized protein n=1 Tax=Acanthoscelides obtectus TaxID=200917 RepID=A0A9P0LWG1_ACAOB|nr:unnamed protein product [Acanthoscelides obtectus]CAK1638742.1 hypothetical protein AOBTE_LOCUS10798 [Acanthoscelides obtectus]
MKYDIRGPNSKKKVVMRLNNDKIGPRISGFNEAQMIVHLEYFTDKETVKRSQQQEGGYNYLLMNDQSAYEACSG